MPRLRRSDCSGAGITRKRCGRGFTYLSVSGERVTDPATIERIEALAIPPAWTDVWICTDTQGHLQALGTDAAGRRQYLYHTQWRATQDRRKFGQMMAFAEALPKLREDCQRDLASTKDPTRDRVLAGGLRMLDRGFFRIGSEQYADENGTFGLATLRKDHVRFEPPYIVFDYVAKHSKRRVQALANSELHELLRQLKRRRAGGDELLAYRTKGSWVDVKSTDINDYIKASIGDEFSAKDFRTWHATVLCAMALAIAETNEALRSTTRKNRITSSPTAGKRVISRAVKEVAHYLGNTPAVCRASYIDPRVFDRYLAGNTIAPVVEKLGTLADLEQPEMQLVIEAAVCELLSGKSERAIERAADRVIREVTPA